jgi:hypothetical protein
VNKSEYALRTSWKSPGCAGCVVAYPDCGNRLSSLDRTSPLIIALQLQHEQYKWYESRTSSDGTIAVQTRLLFQSHKNTPNLFPQPSRRDAPRHCTTPPHTHLPSPPCICLPPHFWRRYRRQVWPNKPNPQRQQRRHLRRLLVRQQQHVELR